MATVQLADIYVPVPFNNAVFQAAIERNAFIASGIMVPDEELARLATVGGVVGEMPSWNPLGTDEPNYSTDNPASSATPLKTSSAKEIYRRAAMNQGWSVMDLAREIAGNTSDPLGAVANRVGGYWATQTEKRVIQSALGVLADNKANDSGDMVKTVANDNAAAVADAERIGVDAVIDTLQTLGDHKEMINAIALHSVSHARLQKQGALVDNFDPQTGALRYQTYLGMRVVQDDSLPAVAGSNRITYTSILFGAGAFGYGAGAPTVPSELDRKPATGDGGGETLIWSRRTDIIHPRGFQFTSSSVAGTTATLAELVAAANWDRVYARKNIPVAFLETND